MQEAYPGWTSVFIWLLVAHSGQREIRERHHYSVDVVAGIYVGILLWRTTSWVWSARDRGQELRLKQLALVEGDIQKAAKEGDVDKNQVDVDKSGQGRKGREAVRYRTLHFWRWYFVHNTLVGASSFCLDC